MNNKLTLYSLLAPISRQLHLKKFSQNFCAITCNISLLLNSFLPYFAAVPAYAQEADPTPIVESIPTPATDPIVSETPTETPAEPIVSPEPTAEPTAIPTAEPVVTPEATLEPTAIPTEEPTLTPEPTIDPTITPVVTEEPTITPETTPTENNNQSNSPSNPVPDTSSVIPTPAFMEPLSTPTPTPSSVEQICLTSDIPIRDSVELDWNYDEANDIYVTREKVQLGIKYIFPKENNVTVTFTTLPKDELYRSYLKIKQVKTSDLKLPQDLGNVGEYAYDITTDMFDGEFKYDITLPKNPDQTAEISYIEKSLEQAKVSVLSSEINSIDESKVEQQDNSIKATSVDHFTIFIVYMFDINGQEVVNPSEPDSNHKIGICHSTGSASNPYTNPTVDDSSILGTSPGSHGNDPNDIIPKFDYKLWEKTGSHLVCPSNYTLIGNVCKRSGHSDRTPTSVDDFGWVTHTYLGKNWTVINQAILNNGCVVPLACGETHTYEKTDDYSNSEVDINFDNNNNRAIVTAKSGYNLVSIVYDWSGDGESNLDDSWSVSTNPAVINASGDVTDVRVVIAKSCPVNNATIIAHNFDDTNGDGVLDAGEVSEAFPWNMYLYTGSNCSGTPIANGGTSLPSGNFTFSNLAAGNYSVSEDLMNAAYIFTTASCQNVTLAAGDNKTLNFGNYAYGEISGQKFNDLNGNGTKESGENGISGVTIYLDKNVNGVFDVGDVSTTTDTSGNYIFSNLTPGTYHGYSYALKEIVPTGWTQTLPAQNVYYVTVVSGTAATGYNFGNKQSTGSLKIIKDSQPDDTQNFIFRLIHFDNNNTPIGFTELDDDNIPDSRPNEHTFNNLIPGSYIVNEDPVSGWTLDNVTCTAREYVFNAGSLKVLIPPGENVTCTFTNTRSTGTITIIKDSVNDSQDNFYFDSNFPSGDFELEDDGNSGDGGTPETKTFTIPIGSYWVDERDATGWKLTDIVCSGDDHGFINKTSGKVEFDLDKNESIICTYTNKKLASITIIKDAHPNSSQDFRFTGTLGSFTLDDDNNNTYSNTKSFNSLLPGVYTVNETPIGGWLQGDISCTGATVETHLGQVIITLDYNQNASCTFNNIKGGSISGHKWDDTDGDGRWDSNENGKSNWKIFIETNRNDVFDNGESYDMTDNDGDYGFDHLSPGVYRICEEERTADAWHNTSGGICQNVTINPGEERQNINFGNQQLGSIRVCKVTLDGEQNIVNGSEVLGSTFTIDWDRSLADTVISAGYTPNTKIFNSSAGNDAICTTYNNLPIAAYHYSQESINNSSIWETAKYNDQYESNIDDIGDFYAYNTNSDSNGEIDLRNNAGVNRTLVILNQYQFGKVIVTKFNDLNGNGQYDEDTEETLPGWTVNLSGDTKVTTDKGATFDQLTPYTYTLSETMQDGWTQTNIYCLGDTPPNPTVTPTPTPICTGGDPDSDTVCSGVDNCPNNGNADQLDDDNDGIGNVCDPMDCNPATHNIDSEGMCNPNNPNAVFNLVKPVMAMNTIDVNPNNHLVTVNAGDNKYCYIGNRLVTPTAEISKSNDAPDDGLSPGNSVNYKIIVKILGNSVKGLKVTDLLSNGFVYRSGSYKIIKNGTDNLTVGITEPHYQSPGAWNLGDFNAGDELVLTYTADISTAQQPGLYYDLAWADGQAAYESKTVLAVAQSLGYVSENFVGTEVPVVRSTQNSVSAGVEKHEEGQVLGASTQLPSTGANSIWLIICTFMSLLGFSLIKKTPRKLIAILFFAAFYFFPINTFAEDNLSVRLEQPKSPTNQNDLKLIFVALEVEGTNPITVKCYKKTPSDGAYSQFGSDIYLSAPGNSSQCQVDSSILNSEGTYLFYVTANGFFSNIVSTDYKTSGPGTPSDYRKDHPNSCDYKIHFKTADDGGKTVKVEIYRSDLTSFILDAGSVVTTVNVGSNEEREITNTVPDCNKTYYYVLRAFDSAGNGSGTIGDSVTVTSTSTILGTTTSSTSTANAIPVINITLTPEEESLQAISPTPETDTQEGSVLGTVESTKNFLQKYWILLILVLVIIASIIGYVLSKNKGSRR